MVSHNVDVHACAIKRSKIRSHDDAFRISEGNKRDHSKSSDLYAHSIGNELYNSVIRLQLYTE